MLEYNNKIYIKVLNIAEKNNVLANCREYPSLFLNRKKVDFNFVRRSLHDKIFDEKTNIGLYVHFPFCASRCTFCKYYSEISTNKTVFYSYLDNLNKELNLYGIDFKKKLFNNLFLGGGTPTLMDSHGMEKFLDIIFRHFSFQDKAQKTIEGTPETLDYKKLKSYRKLGINRISIGLQSSNDKVLKNIGRRHTVSDVFRAFNEARNAGIGHIGTEIIWGLPGENRESYKKTIRDVIKLSPDFIEGYLLTTGARVKIKRYYPPGVDLDEIIKYSKDKFLSNGYRIYYSSNFLGFIKKGISKDKAMNQNTDGLYNYKSDVLGVGAGASSHFRDHKYKIISDYERYSNRLKENNFPEIFGVKITADDYKRHYIILQIGFFRSIIKSRYRELFNSEFEQDFPGEIKYLKQKGIIREFKNKYVWKLSEREMGHKAFFMHVIQYWYNPQYIKTIIERYG